VRLYPSAKPESVRVVQAIQALDFRYFDTLVFISMEHCWQLHLTELIPNDLNAFRTTAFFEGPSVGKVSPIVGIGGSYTAWN
jgi:hypothetical protein